MRVEHEVVCSIALRARKGSLIDFIKVQSYMCVVCVTHVADMFRKVNIL